MLGSHGSLSLIGKELLWGSWEAFRWMVNGTPPKDAKEGPREGHRDVFCFRVPWGPRGRLRQAPRREGVNKQQVIKHDKR